MNALQRYAKPLMWFSALLMTAVLSGCGGGDQGRAALLGLPAADLVSVTVTPANGAIPVGATQQFVAIASFADGASRDVSAASTWTSADPAIASVVAATGAARGVASGSTQIQASFASKSGSTGLTVSPASLVTLALTPANPTIGIGARQLFALTGNYSDGSSHDLTAGATLISGTPAVVGVGNGAVATGLAQGSSLISASAGGMSASTTLTVTAATLSSLALTPANPTLKIGATQQLSTTATFSDASTRDVTASASYVSATPTAATVGASTGLSTGIAAGSSLVTASYGGKSATSTVTVSPVTLNAITVTPATQNILIGATQKLVATGTYSDASSADISANVVWTSSSTTVASILPGGVASALAAGTATITARSGTLSATAALTVSAPLSMTGLAVTPANPSALIGANQQFSATASFSDGSTSDVSATTVWSSSLTGIATILPNGQALAVAAGVSTISASQGGRTATTNFTVTAAPVGGGTSVNLRSAANFGVLAATSITNNSGGTTLVTGDVGSPSQTVDPVQAAGFANYKSGAILDKALADLQLAVTDANSRTCDVDSAAGIDLGGLTFSPGVYCYAGAISITGTFTMNGPGVYIFRTASTLNTTANSIVALNGGASADEVSWLPVGPATLGANSFFKGNIMGQVGAITLGDNANLQNGRVLTGSAATLRNNVISR